MAALEILVLVGAVIVGGGYLADRLKIAGPLILMAIGAILSFVQVLPVINLPAQLVLLLFLPALLYWESLTTSLREIHANRRSIAMLGVGLVVVTAAAVAWLGHWWGLSWPMAWALGAVVAPTDATAISAVAGRLPRRTLTTLKAESLINDGTALVIYAVAVGVTVGEQTPSALGLALRGLWSYAGGIAIGVLVGVLVVQLRKRLDDSRLENSLGVLTPFLAYLPAEQVQASGVVAVVTCGLAISQAGPRIIAAGTRQQAMGFWQVSSYLLNSALFVLIGLQVRSILSAVNGSSMAGALALGVGTGFLVILVRLMWLYVVPYATRLLTRRPPPEGYRVRARHRLPIAWAGFRGAVSLAAALGLPLTTTSGQNLPNRNLVILVTFVVIVITLVVQGLTMPRAILWARLPEDPTQQSEILTAQRTMALAAKESLDAHMSDQDAHERVGEQLHAELDLELHRLEQASQDQNASANLGSESSGGDDVAAEQRVRAALLGDQRDALVQLRDDGIIDDIVLRQIQVLLDAEEIRVVDGLSPTI